MTPTKDDLKKIAELAYLDCELDQRTQLIEDVAAIMSFGAQLQKIETKNIAPLFHPHHLEQRLRVDEISEENHCSALAAIAPLFEDGLYLVPKVIDSGH